MKFSPFSFLICPFFIIPVMVITLTLLNVHRAHGQTVATNSSLNPSKKALFQVSLDDSHLINSSATTFIRYSLIGNFEAAKIVFQNENGKTLKEIPVLKDSDGAIIVYANSIPEGFYKYSLVVDGQTEIIRNLHVVR